MAHIRRLCTHPSAYTTNGHRNWQAVNFCLHPKADKLQYTNNPPGRNYTPSVYNRRP